mgnify:CR=1 FL=1
MISEIEREKVLKQLDDAAEAIRNNQKRIAFRSVNRRKGFFLGTRVIQRRT